MKPSWVDPLPSIAVAIAALVLAFAGSATAQIPNPLPLQNPPPPHVTVTRFAAANTTAVVFCASNEVVTGGGAFSGGLIGSNPVDASGTAIQASGSTGARGWRASAQQGVLVQVWAICLRS